MCGIVGFAGLTPVDRPLLQRAADALSHRGPDSYGEWLSVDSNVGLAHRRLAVIDLSPAAHQPMVDNETGNVLVYNGEVYNFQDLRQQLSEFGHTFTSQSDTEVVLKAYAEWGTDCPAHLEGMFAFAIYDIRRKEFFIARDRVGEKPLFYRHSASEFAFASELKALLRCDASPRFDLEALDCYLGMGYIPGSKCILSGYCKLPPAHALVFNPACGSIRSWPYWELPECPEEIVEEVEGLEECLESLLADSVRRQLVADVPVGVMLSGGVDSSIITALATRIRSDIKTFSVRFPGHKSIDETEHARLVARAFETDHVELSASEAEPDLLSRLAKQFDEPIVDSSMVPTYLVSETVRSQCTVALGGDGGDELFGGYREYTRLDWLQRRMGKCPRLFRQALASIAKYGLEPGVKGRNWLIAQGIDFDRELPLIANYFEPEYRRKLLPHVNLPMSAESIFSSRVVHGNQIIDRATRTDFNNYLPEDLLVKVDRSSMLKSLEVRSPFLDVRVIDFAFGRVPISLKAGIHGRKLLLKRVASRLLPQGFDLNRKQGFSIPIDTWLTDGAWRGFFREVLLDSGCMFHGKSVERIMRGLDRGRNNGERIFSLLMMELWRKEYGVHF